MHIIYIGDVLPENIFPAVSSVNPSTNNVQLSFIHYFNEAYQNNFHVISRNWGTRKLSFSKSKLVETMKFQTKDGIIIETISFYKNKSLINLSAFFSLWYKIRQHRRQIIYKHPHEKILFIVHNPFYGKSLPALLAKHKNDFLITILSEGLDIRYLQEKKIRIHDHVIHYLHKTMLKKNDGIITFCAESVKRYAPNTPYIEIFHSCDSRDFQEKKQYEKRKEKMVLYAGLINPCYGIINILDAMKNLSQNYRLVICGGGEMEIIDQIKDAALKDNRIKYLGLIPRVEALRLEQLSDVLLMIRTARTKSEKYIAKYCQPSKLPEYMLSGTPILSTDIPAIPSSAKPYLNITDTNRIAEDIVAICESDFNASIRKAEEARNFALQECNVIKQNNAIISFVKKITNDKLSKS